MINYQNRTYRDIHDEIILRLSDYMSTENIDTHSVMIAINRAIQTVYVRTLPFKDWAYKSIVQVSTGTWLTERFVKPERVLLSKTGAAPYKEARYASPTEFFTTTSWEHQATWNQASLDSPIFTIYGNTIYTAPCDFQEDPIQDNSSVQGILEGYFVPDMNFVLDRAIPIPYEYEEIVVVEAMLRVLYKTGERSSIYTLFGLINKLEANNMESNKMATYTAKRELQTFVSEEETPFRPPMPLQGELPKQLT